MKARGTKKYRPGLRWGNGDPASRRTAGWLHNTKADCVIARSWLTVTLLPYPLFRWCSAAMARGFTSARLSSRSCHTSISTNIIQLDAWNTHLANRSLGISMAHQACFALWSRRLPSKRSNDARSMPEHTLLPTHLEHDRSREEGR